jgi:hypothetical protein
LSDESWPNWRTGQVLRAVELRALESYLLAATSITSDGSHGVTWLHTAESVGVTPYDGALLVQVHKAAGLTPAGRPVAIGEVDTYRDGEVWLEDPQPAVQALLAMAAMNRAVLLDTFVDVGRGEEPNKLAARAVLCPEDSPPPELEVDALYLGRYRWNPADPHRLQLAARPLVRTLQALRPWDGPWEQWTGELQFRLRENLERVEAEAGATPRGVAMLALTEAWALYDGWPGFTWVEICSRWQRVLRLKKAVAAGLAVVRPHEVKSWRPADAGGDLLPSRLVSHNFVAPTKSAYAQWRLPEGVVLEGLLKDDYLQFWIVGGGRLPRGRLHLEFKGTPPARLEAARGDGLDLVEISPNPDNPGRFNLHGLAPWLTQGQNATLRGLGRVSEHHITFRMA